MEHVLEMGTTKRHNWLISGIIRDIWSQFKQEIVNSKVTPLHEQVALCYHGSPLEVDFIELIDVDVDEVKHIHDLRIVQPDFLLFKNNKYITNERETRYAGRPDLIIEVWSEDNKPNHRLFKQILYSTSPVTEHWYIEQDSNEVVCMLGKNKMPTQSLKNILTTQEGIEIDLRYLAL